MTIPEYDLAIIGVGAAGLIAADFGLQLGAKVALLESDRIGGDCTWSGCVPSKSLIKVATVAQHIRTASRYGLSTVPPITQLSRVRDYVQGTVAQIYAPTHPDALRDRGFSVYMGPTRFLDSHRLEVAADRLRARRIVICTGAAPYPPDIAGLAEVPYSNYRDIFQNDELPARMIVIGGGPVGCEVAQAYQRLGTQVTVVAERLLPRAEPEVSELLARVLTREGLELHVGRAQSVRREGAIIHVRTTQGQISAERLFVAAGRRPRIDELGLGAAGVRRTLTGIEVNRYLQTSQSHIYAAGDVLGGLQYSHLAGWQGFQAARNALLPGRSVGLPEHVPQVTFTVPEVAQVGLTEPVARKRFGSNIQCHSFDLSRVDRAVSEDDREGLLKIIAAANGQILGATIVGERAGEAISEVTLAMSNKIPLKNLAASIHPYPTYNSGWQFLATHLAMQKTFSGTSGRLIRALSRWSLGRKPLGSIQAAGAKGAERRGDAA